MKSLFTSNPRLLIPTFLLLVLALSSSTAGAASGYAKISLVSDIPGLARITDPNLVNPWGISHAPMTPFWVSNNGTGVATLYNTAGQPQSLMVTIPTAIGGNPPSKPTGQVFNGTGSFELTPGRPARFIFATEDGTISGWNPGAAATNALLKVDNSAFGAVYKGLAFGNNGSGDFLYAANFTQGKIDVFDSNFSAVSLAGSFTDPNLPAGYAPFNIQNLGNQLFVTYALQNGKDDEPGLGNGFVDKFDLNGNLITRLVSNGALNSPWGLAIAPDQFGHFSNDLLVGNFGDGMIHVYDPVTGELKGALSGIDGNPIVIGGLWALIFGNGGNGGDPNTLYFTAGIQDEQHGLFGSIVVSLPGSLLLLGTGLLGLAAVRKKVS